MQLNNTLRHRHVTNRVTRPLSLSSPVSLSSSSSSSSYDDGSDVVINVSLNLGPKIAAVTSHQPPVTSQRQVTDERSTA